MKFKYTKSIFTLLGKFVINQHHLDCSFFKHCTVFLSDWLLLSAMSAICQLWLVLFRSGNDNDDDGYGALDNTRLACSLKQQSTDDPPEHIILIPSQLVLALIPQWSTLRGETANSNLIFIALNRPGFESTTYHTRREHANHYTTDVWTTNLPK